MTQDAIAMRAQFQNIREVRRSTDFELRDAGDKQLRFTGYASVTESPYSRSDFLGQYDETIARGAFKRSLNEGADVGFLVNHNDLALPLARTKSGTMRLAEDSKGLHVEADFDPTNPAVQALRSAVERGDADEMSFAFRVAEGGQEWSDNFTKRRITGANLHRGDVSLVNAGSNPATGGTVSLRSDALRAAVREATGIDADALLGAFHEVRAGATISAATMEVLSKVLNLVQTADTAVDQALIDLSKLMGVPNPDDQQDADQAGGERGLFTPAEVRFLFS